MKIYTPIGSKERLWEMMQNVNKVKLNEDMNGMAEQNIVLKTAFDKLSQGKLTIKNTDTQTNNNETFVVLNCVDEHNYDLKFTFKLTANEGDQDGVFNVNSIVMTNFSYRNGSIELDENGLKQFNAEHSQDLLNVVSQYADFESQEPEIDEEYFKAVQKIDSYPFGGTPRSMQTMKAYANEKPTNPSLRVKAPELDKYVDENFGSKNFNDLGSVNKPVNLGGYVEKQFNTLPREKQVQFYRRAFEIIKANSGNPNMKTIDVEPDDLYQTTMNLFTRYMEQLNEDNEENIYPDPIGKKFKSKAKYPKPKKKPSTTVKIDEINIKPDKQAEKQAKSDISKHYLKRGDNYSDSLDKWSKNALPYDTKFTKPNDPENVDFNDLRENPESDEIEQLAREKEKTGNVLHGGKGDNKSPTEFDPDQVLMGLKVEMGEHTDDPMVAMEIVLDHLSEDESYYTTKDNPECSAQANAADDAEENDDEMTDVLLGYKPKNVGDEI